MKEGDRISFSVLWNRSGAWNELAIRVLLSLRVKRWKRVRRTEKKSETVVGTKWDRESSSYRDRLHLEWQNRVILNGTRACDQTQFRVVERCCVIETPSHLLKGFSIYFPISFDTANIAKIASTLIYLQRSKTLCFFKRKLIIKKIRRKKFLWRLFFNGTLRVITDSKMVRGRAQHNLFSKIGNGWHPNVSHSTLRKSDKLSLVRFNNERNKQYPIT